MDRRTNIRMDQPQSPSGAFHDVCHFWPLISSVGENALNKWEPAARFTQQGVGTVAILDIGG
jgi:hypothetical protein